MVQSSASNVGQLDFFFLETKSISFYPSIVFQGDVLVAQAAAFFTAGYETSSSAMSFTLYELCWKVMLSRYSIEQNLFFKLCNFSA